jgi:hypothetical protein
LHLKRFNIPPERMFIAFIQPTLISLPHAANFPFDASLLLLWIRTFFWVLESILQ